MNTKTTRTPQQASKDSREAREAWENGKQIQVRMPSKSLEWEDLKNGTDGCPQFTDWSYEFRVKPTPRLRPWKDANEVPFNAIYRDNDWKEGAWSLIIGASSDGFDVYEGTSVTTVEFQYAFSGGKCSLDGGKTWLPCGLAGGWKMSHQFKPGDKVRIGKVKSDPCQEGEAYVKAGAVGIVIDGREIDGQIDVRFKDSSKLPQGTLRRHWWVDVDRLTPVKSRKKQGGAK